MSFRLVFLASERCVMSDSRLFLFLRVAAGLILSLLRGVFIIAVVVAVMTTITAIAVAAIITIIFVLVGVI